MLRQINEDGDIEIICRKGIEAYNGASHDMDEWAHVKFQHQYLVYLV